MLLFILTPLLLLVVLPLLFIWIGAKVGLLAQQLAKRQQRAHTDTHWLWNRDFHQDPPTGEVWPPPPHMEPLNED